MHSALRPYSELLLKLFSNQNSLNSGEAILELVFYRNVQNTTLQYFMSSIRHTFLFIELFFLAAPKNWCIFSYEHSLVWVWSSYFPWLDEPWVHRFRTTDWCFNLKLSWTNTILQWHLFHRRMSYMDVRFTNWTYHISIVYMMLMS